MPKLKMPLIKVTNLHLVAKFLEDIRMFYAGIVFLENVKRYSLNKEKFISFQASQNK